MHILKSMILAAALAVAVPAQAAEGHRTYVRHGERYDHDDRRSHRGHQHFRHHHRHGHHQRHHYRHHHRHGYHGGHFRHHRRHHFRHHHRWHRHGHYYRGAAPGFHVVLPDIFVPF